jgi:hypothetical protein
VNEAAQDLRALIALNPIAGEKRTGVRRFWTAREIKILREHYPTAGLEACVPLLPGRTLYAIYQKASQEGLIPSKARGAFPRQRWLSSPQIDAAITQMMQGAPKEGEIKKLARTLGRPYWWVGRRARRLGLTPPRFKEPPWSEAEDEFIAGRAGLSPDIIARHMRGAGYVRTPTAIAVRLKRLHQPTGRNADLSHYTAGGLAKLFGVDVSVVAKGWIRKGLLVAGRRGTERTAAQGGDEYWIDVRDVRRFVIENPHAVDLRKVDKFWFIDLLAIGGAP